MKINLQDVNIMSAIVRPLFQIHLSMVPAVLFTETLYEAGCSYFWMEWLITLKIEINLQWFFCIR